MEAKKEGLVHTDIYDALIYGFRAFVRAAEEAVANVCKWGCAVNEAMADILEVVRISAEEGELINRYGTPKEIHYIIHGRKARTRKKYRNRVLRRAHRNEQRAVTTGEQAHLRNKEIQAERYSLCSGTNHPYCTTEWNNCKVARD